MIKLHKLKVGILFLGLLFVGCSSQPNQTTTPASPFPSTAASTPVGSQVTVGACSQVNFNPTPAPNENSLFGTINANDHTLGPQNAPVTIITYCDLQEPNCANLALTLHTLQAKHPNSLQIIYRHFPLLSVFDKSSIAVQAVEAAHLQGKFWEMQQALYHTQEQWQTLSASDFLNHILQTAESLNLNMSQYKEDIASQQLADFTLEAFENGKKIGLPGVPFILINGQIYAGPRDEYSLDYITGLIALGKRQFNTCPAVVIDPLKTYFAHLKTEKGEIVIRLFANQAPNTVNNFVFLAQQGWYENITFHRVIEGVVAQTGDPSGTGIGGPGYLIDDEFPYNLYFDRPGLVAMANSGPNTNGSQFFITLAPLPQLNGDYSIFGEVVSGMDVLQSLTPRSPTPGQPLPPGDLLISITIEEQ